MSAPTEFGDLAATQNRTTNPQRYALAVQLVVLDGRTMKPIKSEKLEGYGVYDQRRAATSLGGAASPLTGDGADFEAKKLKKACDDAVAQVTASLAKALSRLKEGFHRKERNSRAGEKQENGSKSDPGSFRIAIRREEGNMKRILSLGVIAQLPRPQRPSRRRRRPNSRRSTAFRTPSTRPKPLKGTITLEVERTRTINPYDQPDVGLRMIMFSRDAAGNVMLFDPNGAEGHRFDTAGKYVGLVTKKGQGPGEFSPKPGYWTLFHDPGIWVFGGMKAAHFDDSGRSSRNGP